MARVVDLARARAALAGLDAALARPGPPPRPLSVDDVAALVGVDDDERDVDHEPAPDPDAPPASTRRPRARRPPFVLHRNQRAADEHDPDRNA